MPKNSMRGFRLVPSHIHVTRFTGFLYEKNSYLETNTIKNREHRHKQKKWLAIYRVRRNASNEERKKERKKERGRESEVKAPARLSERVF